MGGSFGDTSLYDYGSHGDDNPMYGAGEGMNPLGVYLDDNRIFLMGAPYNAVEWLVDGYIPLSAWETSTISPLPQSMFSRGNFYGPWELIAADMSSVDVLGWLTDLSTAGTHFSQLTTWIQNGNIGGSSGDWYAGETYGTDIVQDAGLSIVAAGSLGLAAIPLETSYEDSDTGTEHNEKSGIWVTYGAPSAPTINMHDDDYEDLDYAGEFWYNWYETRNPWSLSTLEQTALMLKFGHNPSWEGMGATDLEETNPLFVALSSSMMSIVQAIVTTFPENILTFARTKPLTLDSKDISNIELDEEYQEIDFDYLPSTTGY